MPPTLKRALAPLAELKTVKRTNSDKRGQTSPIILKTQVKRVNLGRNRDLRVRTATFYPA